MFRSLRLSYPRRLSCSLVLLAVLGSVPALAADADVQGEAEGAIVLVDDRGEALGAPVEACFVRGLKTDCVDVPAEAEVPARPFELLRIEGPDHGPVTVRRSEIARGEDGRRRVAVPRKAELRIEASEDAGRVSAALYPADDPDPARPAYRFDVPADGRLMVPAGEWIVALEGRGAAPDLDFLHAAPGSSRTVRFLGRAGWSLVVRVWSGDEGGDDRSPVEKARVSVSISDVGAETIENQAPPTPWRELYGGRTGPWGIVLVPGIEEPVVDLAIEHPDFVSASLVGRTGSPGSIEWVDQRMQRGGTLEVTVRVDGEPAADWGCSLVDETAERVVRRGAGNDPGGTKVAAAVTDPDGHCVLDLLPSGIFLLRVEESGEIGGAAERSAQVVEGETRSVDLDLSPIPVTGTVYRGDEVQPGQQLRMISIGDRPSSGSSTFASETETDEAGEYEMTIWEPGQYLVLLSDASGVSADSRFAEIGSTGEVIDFHLAANDVNGAVVDSEGSPVPRAQVSVVWRRGDGQGMSATTIHADAEGRFTIPLRSERGSLELTARLIDGRRSETATLAITEESAPPPVVLEIREQGGIPGVLVGASGVPVAGAVVGAFPVEGGPGGGDAFGSTHTGVDGTFDVDGGPAPAVRLFATAAGCPLTSAVVENPPPQPVRLVCPSASGEIRLRFVDPEGAPAPGLNVGLTGPDGAIPFGSLASHLGARGLPFTSDRDGNLALPGLPPGSYQVWVPSGGTHDFQVTPGGVAELDVVVDRDR